MVRMEILGLIFDPKLNTMVIVLIDPQRVRALPILIGSMEGNAIALGMKKVATPRPMTHDLIKNMLGQFRVEVIKVVVAALKDDTFYAVIHMVVEDQEIEIDSRPSDAIALAVRMEAPIYCTEKVLKSATDLGLLKQRSDLEGPDELKRWLEGLNLDELGKYKM